MPSNGQNHNVFEKHSQPLSPMGQSNPFENSITMSAYNKVSDRVSNRMDTGAVSAIFMRKLPRNTSHEALRSMLLFAKDFLGADFVPTEHVEDTGYLSAIARFKTLDAAHEARAMLDGKPNNAGEAKMIVEVLHLSPNGGPGQRRNTLDPTANPRPTNSSSSVASSGGQSSRQSSRYNGTFQALDRISPPNGTSAFNNPSMMGNGELPTQDSVSSFQSIFNPQSPIGQHVDRPRGSGKRVIDEDDVDEETGELLKDPVAYAKNDMAGSLGRRSTNPQLPTSRLGGLSLNSASLTSPPLQGFTSSRTVAPLQSPTSAVSPTSFGNLGPNATYQLANQHYQRHNYPPVNPADQNPPCNTLYVGNLPIDTSEDELKAMFSKQRGYKRLCFRTKQNGPMCFVEFEDISFATKALNELYGHPLHNSVKGGIRLSFSKNPLGVRTGQPGSMGPPTPMSPQGPMPGLNGQGNLPSFSTANGPPPGLAAPPGLSGGGLNGPSVGLASPVNGGMMNAGFGGNIPFMNGFALSGLRSPANGLTTPVSGIWNPHIGTFHDHDGFMSGR
ncbi:cell cycle RNA binding protein whi3 [Loxospora ochrophaea]|nr:cell cycle RNA binding protein whi3 [Loxospora ochrophaea]